MFVVIIYQEITGAPWSWSRSGRQGLGLGMNIWIDQLLAQNSARSGYQANTFSATVQILCDLDCIDKAEHFKCPDYEIKHHSTPTYIPHYAKHYIFYLPLYLVTTISLHKKVLQELLEDDPKLELLLQLLL